MSTPQLDEILAALEDAASEERPMRIGHEVARVLHAALTDVQADKAEHEHTWQPLGYDRPGGGSAKVIQACSCGEAREVVL